MIKLSVACSTWAHWEGAGLSSALGQVRSWQEVIFYFLMYIETPVETSILLCNTHHTHSKTKAALEKSFTLNKADRKSTALIYNV